MNIEKIFVCACIRRSEINYLENKKRALKSWETTTKQHWVFYSEKNVLRGVDMLLIKRR